MADSKYLRICNLAQGGMGSVDLVVRREGDFARLYAQKRLLPHLGSDPDLRAMFLEEARIAGLIRHVNVVSVLDVGEDENGPFLVMDLVDGIALSKIITGLAQRRERLPLQVVLEIAARVADGLQAAHELVGQRGAALSVIHRDVSPQNVLVGFDGCPRVTDFGVARALDRASHTTSGVLKGKFGYMTPEQLRFEELDARSDLFALGVVLWEMLALRRLYAGEQSEVFQRIQREPPIDPADERDDVPPALTELLFELLAKDRARRPRDARTVARRLDAIRNEVSAELGAINLAEFLAERFAAERAAQKALIATALDATRALDAPTELRHAPSLHEVSTRIVPAEPATAKLPPRKRKTNVLPWIGALAIVALASIALGAWALHEPEPEIVRLPEAPPPIAAPEPAPAIEPVVIEPVAIEPAAEPPPEEPARARRRPRRARSGVPVWDDY